MDLASQLKGFLDEDGRLTAFPAKRKKKYYALFYLAALFEPGRDYSEKEINDIINSATAFRDPATIRRELYDACFLDRDRNGTRYRLEDSLPDPAQLGLM